MKQWMFVPLVLFLALALAGPTAQATTPPPWKAEFAPAALLGSYINGNVTGPAGSTFQVFLYGQPFNDSTPIFNQSFHLSTNQTTLNLSLPTSLLTLGAYYIRANGTSPTGATVAIYAGVVRVLDPLNETQINQEIYLLEQENLILQGQVLSLSSQISTYQFQASLLFWVFFTLFAVLLFKETLQFFLRRARHRLKGAREAWTGFWTQPNIRTFSGMPVAEAKVITPQGVNPERKFVTGIGETPSRRRTRDEMLRYLASYGRLEPTEGADYWATEDTPEPPRRTKEFKHRAASFKVEDL